MARPTNKELAKKVGISTAEWLFKEFQNPVIQGSEFSWVKFPEMAARHSYVSCFMAFHYKVKGLPELKEICRAACLERAIELVGGMK